MDIKLEIVERFHEKWLLNKQTGCWEWTATKAGKGYGIIKLQKQRKQIYAHRLSYLIHCGPIPKDYQVCHACDNPGCVRPSHLFLGLCSDNLQDMHNKGRHPGDKKKPGTQKLIRVQVERIHELFEQGFSQGQIGRVYDVAQQTVYKILTGKRWPEVYRGIKSRGNG